jgi:hypothetical protein
VPDVKDAYARDERVTAFIRRHGFVQEYAAHPRQILAEQEERRMRFLESVRPDRAQKKPPEPESFRE